jgi:hypothetical protein
LTLALPAALWGLLLLPAVVLLRLLARRPREVVVPSLIPWRGAAEVPPAESRRSLRLDLPLALQLAAVACAVLAAAGPELVRRAAGPRRVVAVLDNSASTAAGGRLADARKKLAGEIASLGDELSGELWVTSPRARRVTGEDAGRSELLAAVDRVRPTEAGGDLSAAVAAARRSAGAGAVLLAASDDLGSLESPGAAETVLIAVGGPVRNFGIVAAALEDGKVFCAVRSAAPAAAEVTVKMAVGDVEEELKAELAPGARRGFTFDLPARVDGFVELRLAAADDLAADNVVRLFARPEPRPAAVCAPGTSAPSTLRALGALGFPPARESAPGELPADARLTVTCGLWPERLPEQGFALVIDPPAGSIAGTGVEASASAAPARPVLGGEEYFPHAEGFTFPIGEARGLELSPGATALLSDGDRVLVALTAGGRACVFGFDPEKTEWVKDPSFPVFFARLAAETPALAAMRRTFYRTGEKAPAGFGRVSAPGGAGVVPGRALSEVGLYRAALPDGRREPVFAANLLNEEETACRAAGRSLRRLLPPDEKRVEGRVPFRPWLFAAALLILAVEWRLAWRGRRG